MRWRASERHGAMYVRALALTLALAGCSTQQSVRDVASTDDAGKAERAAAPSRPATVEINEGVGFTVTEAVTISSAARAKHREALQRFAGGDDRGGIALLEEVIEEIPEATGPYIDLGIAYGRTGEYEKAVEALSAAIAATPDHPVAHNELGIVYRKLGRFAEARASYERALSIYPGFHYARRNLAVLCDLYLADLDCARDNYRAYQAAVPDDDEVEMWVADLRNRAGASE